MDKVKNLIIVQKSEALPDHLRTVFRNKGYLTHTAFNAKAVLQKLADVQMAYLVVDCGQRQDAAPKILSELLSETDIRFFPTVLMSSADAAVDPAESGKFLSFTHLQYPTTAPDVLRALDQFDASLEAYLSQLQAAAPHLFSEASQAISQGEPGGETRLVAAAWSGQENTGISALLFSQIEALKLNQKKLGGSFFNQEITFDVLESRRLVPRSKTERNALDAILGSMPIASHKDLFSRVLIGGHTTSVLPVSPELQDAGLLAVYAMALGFSEDYKLFTVNYTNPFFEKADQQVAICIQKSAERTPRELAGEAARVLRQMSKLIQGVEAARDDEESLVASTLVAADLADRACRENGSWHPRLAYLFLRKLQNGEFNRLHPSSLAIVLKFLGETIGGTEPNHLVSKKQRHNKTLFVEHRAIQDLEVDSGERKVSLASLSPGMRLSRPLQSFDGNTLLPENVVLDQDMITRLWRLATIRIVNAPAVIYAR